MMMATPMNPGPTSEISPRARAETLWTELVACVDPLAEEAIDAGITLDKVVVDHELGHVLQSGAVDA